MVRQGAAQAFVSGRIAHIPLVIGSNDGEDSLMGGRGGRGSCCTHRRRSARRSRRPIPTPTTPSSPATSSATASWAPPARWFAGKAASGAPTWLYEFSYVPPAAHAFFARAPHGEEVLFVFETLDRSPLPASILTPADFALAKSVHGCWVAFAKTGSPTCPNGQAWPKYDLATRPALVFDTQTRVVSGFRDAAYAAQEAAFSARGGPGSTSVVRPTEAATSADHR